MESPRRKFSWPTLIFYICMAIGVIGLSSFMVDQLGITESMVVSGIFALFGSASFVMLLRDRRLGWRIPTLVGWGGALIGIAAFLTEDLNVHEGLAMAIVMPSIGALIYGLFTYYPAKVDGPRPVQFRQLGDPAQRIDPLQNPAERDVPVDRSRR